MQNAYIWGFFIFVYMAHLLKILMSLLTITSFLIMIEISTASYKVYPFPSESWVKYEFYAETNATSQKYRDFVEETAQIAWSQIEIQKSSGTNLTILHTIKFRNETQRVTTHTFDVSTGMGLTLPVVIASNLSPGEQIFANMDFRIKDMKNMSFLDITREINYALLKKYGPLGPDYYYEETHFFWDKETGILCKMETLIFELYEPSEDEKIKEYTIWEMRLVDASPGILKIWIREDHPAIYATLILFAVLIIAISLFIRWKKGS